MACAAFVERGRVPGLGFAGIGLAAVALALVLVLIWIRPSVPDPWVRATLLATIWAVAVAHAELLLLPRLIPAYRWVQGASVGAIALLATLLSLAVYDILDGDGMLQLVAVVSILVALLTLAVPILWKLGRDAEPAASVSSPDRMSLQRGVDGVWVDADGGRYEVRRIDDGGR
jgi:hypothetical protein